jgi:hypothetical protein
LGNVGVIQRCQNLGLALKPGQAVGVVRKAIRQEFQRNVPLQSGVAASKDDAHSAFTKMSSDFVRTDM